MQRGRLQAGRGVGEALEAGLGTPENRRTFFLPLLTTMQRTTYSYRSPVALGSHRLILRPPETRDLRLTSHEIDIAPEAEITWSHDVVGNSIASATFHAEIDRLTI